MPTYPAMVMARQALCCPRQPFSLAAWSWPRQAPCLTPVAHIRALHGTTAWAKDPARNDSPVPNDTPKGSPAAAEGPGPAEPGRSFGSYAKAVWGHRRKAWRYLGYLVAGFAGFQFMRFKLIQRELNTVHPDTVLKWRIAPGSIVEGDPRNQPFSFPSGPSALTDEFVRTLSVLDVVRALNFAAVDDNITGLVVNMTTDGYTGPPRAATLSMAQVQEIRQAVLDLKRRKEKLLGPGKFTTVVYTDTFSDQLEYYLATAFDKVYIQPTGHVSLSGVSRHLPFVKNMLDKLGIHVHAEAREEYKSVVSTATRTELSHPQRENLEQVLTCVNTLLQTDLARARQAQLRAKGAATVETTMQTIHQFMQQGLIMGRDALSKGLVDQLTYQQDVQARFKGRKVMELGHYLGCTPLNPTQRLKTPLAKIGVVYLVGSIMRGGGQYSPAKVAHAIRQAADDEKVNSIVVRIDTPGGDVVGSDTIAAAIDYAQTVKGKPVIASYAGISASGGYFASAHCKYIFALPSTLTGSIGVAMTKLTLQPKFLRRLGITIDSYVHGNQMFSPFTALNAEDAQRVRRLADATYDDFLQRVATGRKLSSEQLKSLAGGRVFTGHQAQQNGLVDGLGGFVHALGYAFLDRVKGADVEGTTTHTLITQLIESSQADSKQYTLEESLIFLPSGPSVASNIYASLVAPVTDIAVFPKPKSLPELLMESQGFDAKREVFAQYVWAHLSALVMQSLQGWAWMAVSQAPAAATQALTTLDTAPRLVSELDVWK
ncbi:hypothetical protein H4R35_000130 [Dimargaris xerosporica]|nr:hypothetical protein H4R35_000130 [Dimargaris xerosporica]